MASAFAWTPRLALRFVTPTGSRDGGGKVQPEQSERQLQRFKSARSAERFLDVHAAVQRYLQSATPTRLPIFTEPLLRSGKVLSQPHGSYFCRQWFDRKRRA